MARKGKRPDPWAPVRVAWDMAKSVGKFAEHVGWRCVGVGRSRSLSAYVWLTRRTDGRRVCLRFSDHRIGRAWRGDPPALEWIYAEHRGQGIGWVKAWLCAEGRASDLGGIGIESLV